MPMIIRPSEMSCSVAYIEASTVGSRVPGFVTKWPSFSRDVSRAASASSGVDSCQRTCESYVQPYSKPCCSASFISSSQRAYGGSGRTVTPNVSIAASIAPLQGSVKVPPGIVAARGEDAVQAARRGEGVREPQRGGAEEAREAEA